MVISRYNRRRILLLAGNRGNKKMKLQIYFSSIHLAIMLAMGCCAESRSETIVINAGTGISDALRPLRPGDKLLLGPGEYPGHQFSSQIHGTADLPITVCGSSVDAPPVIKGGDTAWQLMSCSHLVLENLVFEGSGSNGLNIDDSGTEKSKGSCHHIVLRNLVVRDIGGTGNEDGIKLSGVDDFQIDSCVVEKWGQQGQAIDMVGCHRGKIDNCEINGKNFSSVGIQMKGGSTDIVVNGCRTFGVVDRGLQIGGITGDQFFRPRIEGYEAKRITVRHCVFEGSEASIAFVNAVSCTLEDCILHLPKRWFLRILQEQQGPAFDPCNHGNIRRSIFLYKDRELLSPVNIGAGTDPGSFQFVDNIWFCVDGPTNRDALVLPSDEQRGLYGVDPKIETDGRGKLIKRDSLEQILSNSLIKEKKDRFDFWQNTLVGTLAFVVIAVVYFLTIRQPFPRSVSETGFRSFPQTVDILLFTMVLFGFHVSSLFKNSEIISGSITETLHAYIRTPWEIPDFERSKWFVNVFWCFILGTLSAAWPSATTTGLARQMLFSLAGCVLSAILVISLDIAQLTFSASPVRSGLYYAKSVIVGHSVGLVTWFCIGPSVLNFVRRLFPKTRSFGFLDWMLAAYLITMVYRQLEPFRFVFEPRNLYHRFQGGMLDLDRIPITQHEWSGIFFDSLRFIPLGIACSTWLTNNTRPFRSIRVTIFLCFAISTCLELLQCVVETRVASLVDIVSGLMGSTLGIVICRFVILPHPWLATHAAEKKVAGT
jgi:glycopeptide antibiotics resistance protein